MYTLDMGFEFQEVYGMRFVSLQDPVSNRLNYPNAEAPYPRDVVLDHNGLVRYWATEYDPQKIIEVIAQLLDEAAGIESDAPGPSLLRWDPAFPNPWTDRVALRWRVPRGLSSVSVFDVTGSLINRYGPFTGGGPHRIDWDGADRQGRMVAPGVYFVRLDGGQRAKTLKILRVE